MESIASNGITIYFEPEDRATAELIRPTVAKTERILRDRYGVEPARDCRVYIMRSWQRMFFHATPWPLRIYFALVYPYLYPRASRIWSIAGGWAFPMGRRRVTGIKPPDLLKAADQSIGRKIFAPDLDINDKIRHITCHELTHAFTAAARRHMWLYEGIAMRAVDHLVERATVLPNTLRRLDTRIRDVEAGRTRRVDLSSPDALVYAYARGYWLTRYLEDTHPELLKDLLKTRRSRGQLERELTDKLQIDAGCFWPRINAIVLRHFDALLAD